MRRYETVIIVPADLPEDEIGLLLDRYRAIIAGLKGLAIKVEKWGKRKLAYEIRKHQRGFYLLIDFAGESAVVAELERNLKIDDKVLKFMTVKKEEQVIREDIEKEMAAAAPAAAAAESEAKPTEPAADSPRPREVEKTPDAAGTEQETRGGGE